VSTVAGQFHTRVDDFHRANGRGQGFGFRYGDHVAVRYEYMRAWLVGCLETIADPEQVRRGWIDHDETSGLLRGGWLPWHVLDEIYDRSTDVNSPKGMIGVTLKTTAEAELVSELNTAVDVLHTRNALADDSAFVTFHQWDQVAAIARELARVMRSHGAPVPSPSPAETLARLTSLPEASQGRFDVLRHLLAEWPYLRLGPDDLVARRDVVMAGAHLRSPLPEALVELYRTFGNRGDLMADDGERMSAGRLTTADDVIVFRRDEGDTVRWALRPGMPDPDVLRSVRGGPFEPLGLSVAQYAFTAVLESYGLASCAGSTSDRIEELVSTQIRVDLPAYLDRTYAVTTWHVQRGLLLRQRHHDDGSNRIDVWGQSRDEVVRFRNDHPRIDWDPPGSIEADRASA